MNRAQRAPSSASARASAYERRELQIGIRIHALVDRIPWFGAHAGYEQLAHYLPEAGVDLQCTRSRTTLNQIRIGRAYAAFKRWGADTNPVYAAAELRFAWRQAMLPRGLRHILYGEMHHRFFERWRKVPASLVATLHHPPQQHAQWPPAMVANLRRLSSAIVLYERDREYFEEMIRPGTLYVLRHGVDTEFFCPAADTPDQPRLLYAGQNGRDARVLREVIERLSAKRRDLRFDLLVRPEIRERSPDLLRLADHPAVAWHSGVDDVRLRELYRGAAALLLPLQCAGAVNSLLEALACGVAPVTNDVGGVRDYGGGDVYPLAPCADADAMIELAERLLDDPDHRRAVADRCRQFAVDQLAWPRIAAQHADVYRQVAVRAD